MPALPSPLSRFALIGFSVLSLTACGCMPDRPDNQKRIHTADRITLSALRERDGQFTFSGWMKSVDNEEPAALLDFTKQTIRVDNSPHPVVTAQDTVGIYITTPVAQGGMGPQADIYNQDTRGYYLNIRSGLLWCPLPQYSQESFRVSPGFLKYVHKVAAEGIRKEARDRKEREELMNSQNYRPFLRPIGRGGVSPVMGTKAPDKFKPDN